MKIKVWEVSEVVSSAPPGWELQQAGCRRAAFSKIRQPSPQQTLAFTFWEIYVL